MSSLHQDAKSGICAHRSRFGGKQHHYSLETTKESDARSSQGSIDETLLLMKGRAPCRRQIFWAVLFSGGRLDEKVTLHDTLTLEQVFDRYEKEMPPGSMESSSLETFGFHKRHLLRILGKKMPAQGLSAADLQRYINERLRERYRGKSISPRTVKKKSRPFEPCGIGLALQPLAVALVPVRGLKYGKEDEKYPS